MPAKHIPMRSCIICGDKLAKRELIRIVHATTGEFAVDETGRRAGRGAYLCHKQSCWEQAFKREKLSRALRAEIPAADRERLLAHGAAFRQPASQGASI